MSIRFLAIDFETASYQSDSACALGLVRVESNRIVSKKYFLIRPPSRNFIFTRIHGISWEHVEDAPTFDALWPILLTWFKGIDWVVAHNVGFDKRVLQACCDRYQLKLPQLEFRCTVQLAKKSLGLKQASLPVVCEALKIPLKHHHAESDALACAKIAIAALKAKPDILKTYEVQPKLLSEPSKDRISTN